MNGTNHDVSLRARARRLAAGATIVLAGLAPAGASAHQPGVVLRAFGAATIDGIVSPGEWDAAAHFDFPVDGTPASLSAMNDATNLYVLVRVARASSVGSNVELEFDNDHDGAIVEEGADEFGIGAVLSAPRLPPGFRDAVITSRPPCPTDHWCPLLDDLEAGGTRDGSGAIGGDAATTVFELSHPLDSADDLNDFSLAGGATVGMRFSLTLCSPCIHANHGGYPEGVLDIVVASPDTTAPDTQIASGPESGAFSRSTGASFAFAGTDDVTQPAQLVFECSLDGSPFAACSPPAGYASLGDGTHAFAVRARDRVGNVDPTPATRTWTVDTTPPETSFTETPPSLTRSRAARFAFTGADASGAATAFECALDAATPSACTSPYQVAGLPDGPHTFQVWAIDRAGNGDATDAEHRWTIDGTAPSKPRVRGPRKPAGGRVTYRFLSSDRLTAASVLVFRCAVDSPRLQACSSVVRVRLRPGRHVLRVVAVDQAGNTSAVTRVTVTVRPRGL